MIDFKDLKLDKCADGLVPVIVQDDDTLKVLMLGYMNAEALQKTQTEGKVTFWSRSRGRLWTKGETSGNFLLLKNIYADCDSDTLLVRVNPVGPACHRGTVSCFDTPDNEGFIRALARIIKGRHERMPEDSYTTKLFVKGVKSIAKKCGEESTECIIEAVSGKRDRFIYEVCDVAYHYLVLLEQMGVSVSELEDELAQRHK